MKLRESFALGFALLVSDPSGALGAPAAIRALLSDGRPVMGTVLEIELVGANPAIARAELERAFATVAALEARLSTFVPSSDISRLNQRAGIGPVALQPATLDLLRRAVDAARLTEGVFDVCVGPLVALWKRADRRGHPPSLEELARARRKTDVRRIHFSSNRRAALPDAGMSIDLGGIAKGYALDRVVADLRAAGVQSALLSFGESSVWALGAPPGDEGWRLLLRSPTGGITGQLLLRDRALSVSSSLGQATEIGGRRYGHVIDPRDGRALTRGAEAIVLASDATIAEVLSTALVILEPERGVALAESLAGVEARVADGSGRVVATSGWLVETSFEPLPAR